MLGLGPRGHALQRVALLLDHDHPRSPAAHGRDRTGDRWRRRGAAGNSEGTDADPALDTLDLRLDLLALEEAGEARRDEDRGLDRYVLRHASKTEASSLACGIEPAHYALHH